MGLWKRKEEQAWHEKILILGWLFSFLLYVMPKIQVRDGMLKQWIGKLHLEWLGVKAQQVNQDDW